MPHSSRLPPSALTVSAASSAGDAATAASAGASGAHNALKRGNTAIAPDMFLRFSFKRPVRLRIESKKGSDFEVTEVGSRRRLFRILHKGSRATGTVCLFDGDEQLVYKLKTFAFRLPFYVQVVDGVTKEPVATVIKKSAGHSLHVGNGHNKKQFFMSIDANLKLNMFSTSMATVNTFQMLNVRSGAVVASGHRLSSKMGYELHVTPGHNVALLTMLTLSLQQYYTDHKITGSLKRRFLKRFFSH